MYERIMVPLDGSANAEITLPYAQEIASKLGESISVVTVSVHAGQEGSPLGRYIDRIKERVETKIIEWAGPKKVMVRGDLLKGAPADEIMTYAGKYDINLIVMASHGASQKGPWHLGSMAAKVLRATDRPVLLVRSAPDQAALQQKRLIRRVLVPLDGSDLGEAAVPHVRVLAKALGCEVVLFRVVEPEKTWSGEVSYTPAHLEKRKAAAIPYLEAVGKPLIAEGIKVSNAVALGAPADETIDYAASNHIDVIAMSTHGRSGIGRWVFGSVTDKVLHAGSTAVLVIRAEPKEAKATG